MDTCAPRSFCPHRNPGVPPQKQASPLPIGWLAAAASFPAAPQRRGSEEAETSQKVPGTPPRDALLPPPPLSVSPAAGQPDYGVPRRGSASRPQPRLLRASACRSSTEMTSPFERNKTNALKPLTSTAVLNRITRQLQCDYRLSDAATPTDALSEASHDGQTLPQRR